MENENKIIMPSDEYFVDLGLPSGVVWATRNIDVTQADGFAVSPYTYDCSYFSWGNTDGHNLNTVGTFDYDWGSVNSQAPWYDGQPYGETSGSTIMTDLPLYADAARVNLGKPWRMATNQETIELNTYTDVIDLSGNVLSSNYAITIDGVMGQLLQSKINGNRIFFPFCGRGRGMQLYDKDVYFLGYLSTLDFNDKPIEEYARICYGGNSVKVKGNSVNPRYVAFPIRPVFTYSRFTNEHIKFFDTVIKYNDFKLSEGYIEPNVSYIEGDDSVRYNKDYSKDYLTFVTLEDGTFTLNIGSAVTTAMVESVSYSLDNGETWITTNNANDENVTITTPTVKKGKKVLWKGIGTQMGASGNTSNEEEITIVASRFESSGKFNVQGNVMSLLYGDNFVDADGFASGTTRNFMFLFGWGYTDNKVKLVSAKNLVLKYTNDRCYTCMFCNCNLLIEPPELPSMELAERCYQNMFRYCISLTKAPKLSAIELAPYCCANMFSYCYKLNELPTLPATALTVSCYDNMFRSCISLTNVPSGYLPATVLAEYCYRSLFIDCTGITTAEVVLPATTLPHYCYAYLFGRCTNLRSVPSNLMAAATTLGTEVCDYMFQNCTSLTVAPDLPATTLSEGCYGNMFVGCSNLNSVKCLATDISATNCTSNWLSGVAASGTFTKAASMTSWATGVNGIPDGWTVVDAS